VTDDPSLAGPVLFGAHALLATDDVASAAIVEAWRQDRTSLREPRSALAASS
jgi:hypothetical protein